jgi:antitoxin component YwqK of YwqJK toxin-antitoxin module
MKDITPYNKGQRHGYWEIYFTNGKLWTKCYFINDKEVGYQEYYIHELNIKGKNSIIFNL